MLKIDKETTIYVVCPAFNKTGGTELEHQLVHEINELGGNAVITYYGTASRELNPAFEEYVTTFKKIDDIVDDPHNIIVIPEIRVDLISQYSRIQKCIWWMSVDNFLKRNGFSNSIKAYGLARTIKYAFERKIKVSEPKLSNQVLHLYQSEYARVFLESRGIHNVARLSDYVNQEYLVPVEYSSRGRINDVLYNPKKGIDFTKQIMEKSEGIKWTPIQNMSTQQVRELLRKGKIYIDFGNHPGKDRFPREAAISGCCVITDKKGSAKYSKDVPIPEEYKFTDTKNNLPAIIDKINECIYEYDCCIDDFSEYREFIRKERDTFNKDVYDLFIEK